MKKQEIIQSPNDFIGTWKKILKYSKKYSKYIFIAFICACIGAIFTLMGPNMVSDITKLISDGIMEYMVTLNTALETGIDINGINVNIDLESVTKIGTTLAIIYSVGFILLVTQGLIMASVTQKITKNMRSDISKKINKLPFGYFETNNQGDILSRVTNDVDTVSQSLNTSVGALIINVSLFVGSLIMMIYTNIILTITAILSTFIGFVLMILIMKKSQKFFTEQQKNIGSVNGYIDELYSSHMIVKAYNAEDEAQNEFDKLNGLLKVSAFKAQSLSGLMMPIMTFIGNLGYVCVCIVGAILTMNDQIGVEIIVAFIMYVRYFTMPLAQIAQSTQSMQSAAAAAERVFSFLEEENMDDESHKKLTKHKFIGNAEFKNVSFGYTEDKTIINDFSVSIKAGQKVAIVGPTGAGKTTIVNLLMRFYEINKGTILLDGIDTKDMLREEVHSQFCMVLQDTWIFEGTIKENLVYSEKNISNKEIVNVCKLLGIDHFINTLPKKYDTVIGDNISLSSGQKQQLTIARAMLRNKPMLILDEATSSVDTRTELIIQNAMDELMKNRTSFVIAHRLSTIKNADIILVMKDGEIIESGNHDQLVELGGFYKDLYNSQFENKN